MAICEMCKQRFEKPKSACISNHPLYRIFIGIKQRCCNPNNKDYKNYGARGISVCQEWLDDSSIFIKWALDNGWKIGLHTDRINNDGNYEPNNCQFITNAQNQRNRRPAIKGVSRLKINVDGVEYFLADLAKKYDINLCTLWNRVNRYNWDIKDVLKPARLRKMVKH